MNEDPIISARYRFPAEPHAMDWPSRDGSGVRPFGTRFARPVEMGKHEKPPTKVTVSLPSQTGPDGDAKPAKNDDAPVPGRD